MSAGGEDRITMLERRCRVLLRPYPAAYRAERAEEIIGTLLEATPDDRAWPLPRDIRGLVAGSLRARAALNRRNTTAANLRVAVLVGVAAYLAYVVAGVLADLVSAEHVILNARGVFPAPFGWPLLVVAPLITLTLVLAWLSRRRAIVITGALPAAAAVAVVGRWGPNAFGSPVTVLACLAALIALAGRERPDRRWLWLIGPIVLVQLLIARALPGIGARASGVLAVCLLLTLLVVSIAWVAVDARPAIALVVFLLVLSLPTMLGQLASGVIPPANMMVLAIYSAVGALAVWRLRRQSAHPGRPTRI